MEKKNDKTIAKLVMIILGIILFTAGIVALNAKSDKEKADDTVVTSTSSSDDEEDYDYDDEDDEDDDYSYSSSYSSSSSYSYSSSSEFNPAEYEVPDFNTWNHDQLEYGKKVQITGKVLQTLKDGSYYNFRLAMDEDYDKVVLVELSSYEYSDVIAEDDNVTFYGTAEGLTSYESTWGKEVTLPSMDGSKYTVNSYGN
ncbi:hypothetical protein [Streptococcus equinus]|uniref:hypothetical protein n=1 Tax=Streptococcus equinus TaxID=1335 RepID=UPI00215A6938|nr:hypothetical protein [Streptococcus equinus]UVF03530.1 hypothetical protein KRG72_04350 [Streptococcus equinus]